MNAAEIALTHREKAELKAECLKWETAYQEAAQYASVLETKIGNLKSVLWNISELAEKYHSTPKIALEAMKLARKARDL